MIPPGGRAGLRPPPADAFADIAPLGDRPVLTVVVDTEEEFDWSKPHSRAAVAVTSIAAQDRAQAICDRWGVVPTYVVDYPVAADAAAAATLRGFADAGRAVIGTHLHPWVNPPHDEDVTIFNSFAGNLPPALEGAKLAVLTDTIERAFGKRPTIYKAGRYGIGASTPGLLAALGYRVDISVFARLLPDGDGGPDFRAFPPRPYWLTPDRSVLEIPLACGFFGLLADAGPRLSPRTQAGLAARLRVPGILSRLRLLEQSRLTPESVDLGELKRITRALVAQGHRVLQFAWHSPSLVAGHTPYVRTDAELTAFLAKLDGYFSFFFNELGGRALTPLEIRAELDQAARQAV
jgi:hypothetical protein